MDDHLTKQQRYAQKFDSIYLRLPKGTKKRIEDLGYTGKEFCEMAVFDMLMKLEKIKPL